MYDYVFITHLPAFYKINLYNELAKQLNIYVIFISNSSSIRTEDFTKGERNFDYEVINQEDFELRNKWKSSLQVAKTLYKLSYNKVVVGGWDLLEFWIIVFFNKKSKNALVVESTAMESDAKGLKGLVKKFFINRISLAFPSGKLHLELLSNLGYKERYFFTKGVGIFNRAIVKKENKSFSNKFLYVGRMSEEKNLDFLINYFNKNKDYQLTLVGKGPLEDKLKEISNENIKFLSHVPNSEIHKIYQENDIFILPSISEPWGLVVDEALYYGLPVIVSNKVGCATELVEENINGEIFVYNSEDEFNKKLTKIIHNFEIYRKNVLNVGFELRDKVQIDAYVKGAK